MTEKKSYVFGPVPSRRLGRSLGIDVVPLKACTLDCIYCQLGRTPKTTIEFSCYYPVEKILAEFRGKLASGIKVDYITISGSGEPTLHSGLGDIIDGIKKETNIPVAVLTNGTTFYYPHVRSACAKADVVMPSLDAGDEETFRKINRPHSEITFERLVDGLSKFRKEFTGEIWLEVFIIKGINDDIDQLMLIRHAIDQIKPDKIHLNTAVRPTAEPDVVKLTKLELKNISLRLGGKCEVIADFPKRNKVAKLSGRRAQDILDLISRHPATLEDICEGLDMAELEVSKHLEHLIKSKNVTTEQKGTNIFYKAL